MSITARIITAIWLIFIYAISIWSGTGALSCLQIQLNAASNENSPSYSELIRQLEGHGVQLKEQQLHVNELRQQWNLANENYLEYNDRNQDLQQDLARMAASYNLQVLDILNPDIKIPEPEFATKESEKNWKEFIFLRNLAILDKKNGHVFKERAMETKNSYQQGVSELSKTANYENNDLLSNHVADILFLRKLKFDKLLGMRQELTTLIMMMSMGCLGSAIFLTHYLFQNGTQKIVFRPSWLLFRPLLGIVTALSCFILIKSGLMVVTEKGSDTVTNVFFMAFVAICTGILSDQAYDKMRSIGQGIFKTQKGSSSGASNI